MVGKSKNSIGFTQLKCDQAMYVKHLRNTAFDAFIVVPNENYMSCFLRGVFSSNSSLQPSIDCEVQSLGWLCVVG
ncbi:MAG: hypothetical protein JW384_01461 [Nitrosomonadaceae bacterium]|nr:hypothetical protein [Nitrosomonadaceae bacterium]